MTFSQWMDDLMNIVVNKCDFLDTSKGRDMPLPKMANEMTEIVFKESVDFNQFMSAPLDENLSEMTSIFAMNCMLVSILACIGFLLKYQFLRLLKNLNDKIALGSNCFM